MSKFARPVPPVSRFVACLALILVLAAPRLAADEFGYHEMGARAAALGGAFTARADDITALFYNPAGLAFLGGFRIKTNVTFAGRRTTAAWPETQPPFQTNPHELYGNHFLSWQPIRRVTLALGLFSTYTFDSLWPSTWDGEEYSTSAKLKGRYFRSAVAVELFKGLAVSGGLDVVRLSVEWKHRLPFQTPNYPLEEPAMVLSREELSGHGLGYAAGVMWKLFPALQVGARYHRRVAVDLAGINRFSLPAESNYIAVPDPYIPYRLLYQLLDFYYADQSVTGSVALPSELAVGAALTPFPKLSLSFDVVWTKWSEFGAWEFRSVNEGGTLSPEFTSVHEEFYGMSPDYGVQSAPAAALDTRKYKAGVEYRVGRWISVRGGYARHESAVDAAGLTPLYPDLERNIFSMGAGYEGPLFSIWDEDESISMLSFDLFLRYATAAGATSTLPGLEMTYASSRWAAGVGVGFIF